MNKMPETNEELDNERFRADTATEGLELRCMDMYNKAEEDLKNRLWIGHYKHEIHVDKMDFRKLIGSHFLLFSGQLTIPFRDEWLKILEDKLMDYGE